MATKERIAIENLLMIADKEGVDMDFKLNIAQCTVDDNLTGRDLIPKARQMGVSSYFLARYTVACLGQRNTRAVVISHDKESTQRMLHKVHYYLENIKGPKAEIKNASKNELTFPKTNSMFYIGTAGARKFGRGDTITHLHCSEVAYWPDPKALTKGLFQAVPRSGEIAMESTGNGTGNFYHRACVRAEEKKGRWRNHFLNWLNFAEYDIDLTPSEADYVLSTLDEDLGEIELVDVYGLTAGQIQFRREKLEELDFDVTGFEQEYPITLDECFQSTGYSLFKKIKHYIPSKDWIRMDKYLHVMIEEYKHHPSKYALGVDVGGGVGRDRSVIEIIDLIKWEQVGEWVGDNIAPDVLAKRVKEIAEYWNNAYVTVESNNYGSTTLLALTDIYPRSLIFRSKQDSDNIVHYGYRTTSKTKPILIGNLRYELATDLIIHSSLLKDELSTFGEQDNGKLEAESGCFDDRVMGLAVGAIGAVRAGYLIQQQEYAKKQNDYVDPFSLEGIIASCHNQTGMEDNLPIPRQDLGAMR